MAKCLKDYLSVSGNGFTVFHGSNLDVLPLMADNSVDSIVTDPPYELGFMGKSWDSTGIAYSVELWAECLRVLKPGGHLLAFGGSRTWHRLAVAIEDAGFEVRDSIAWLYGSGFPKSLNISKAVDTLRAKEANDGLLPDEAKFCEWMRDHSGLTESKSKELLGSARFITGVVEIVNTGTTDKPHMGRRAMIPTAAAWKKIKPILATEPPEWVEALVKEPPKPTIEHPSDWKSGKGEGTVGDNEWAGWGTALKPAFEPVVVARKPLIGTVAENVLTWGVGGLNIDGSRIGTDQVESGRAGRNEAQSGAFGSGLMDTVKGYSQGRWPANIILDEYTAELLDEQSGVLKSGDLKPYTRSTTPDVYGLGMAKEGKPVTYNRNGDSGGASRFFYVAKASRRDRNEGLDGLETKQSSGGGGGIGDYLEDVNSASGKYGSEKAPAKNFHPTVKPTDLMRYLIKLVTPAGGTVLDPFTGSGSTGKAALLDGYKFTGIELTADYLPIIDGRLKWAAEQANKQEEEKEERLF